MNKLVKLFIELGPLLTFFLLYKFTGKDDNDSLINATIGIVLCFALALSLSLYYEKKVEPITLITAAMFTIFGSLTLFTGNTIFIKMKPTIINVFFASSIFIGLWMDKYVIKLILGKSIEMNNENWRILSKRCILFFLILAITNEIVWRNFPINYWVNFKVFGIIIFTSLFLLSQIKFINDNNYKN